MNDNPYVSMMHIHDADTIEVKRGGPDLNSISIEVIGGDPFRKTIINVWKGDDGRPELRIEGRRVEVA